MKTNVAILLWEKWLLNQKYLDQKTGSACIWNLIDLWNIILLTLTQMSICLSPVEESVFRIPPSFIDCICHVGNTRKKACLIISLLKLAVMLFSSFYC